MRKYLLIIFSVMLLVACGTSENEESNTTADEEESESNNGPSEEVVKEINEVIADDELVKVEIVDLVFKKGDERGERYNININVENKTDETIDVSAGEFSIDGKMEDEMIFYSEEVPGGKEADTVIEINNQEEEQPEIKENIEFNFDLAQNMELIESYEVKIDLD